MGARQFGKFLPMIEWPMHAPNASACQDQIRRTIAKRIAESGDDLKQIVYLDVLILLNFVVDYFLLLGVKKLNRANTRLRRMMLGSLTAAMCSIAIFLPGENPFLSTLYQLLTALLAVWAAFGFGSLPRYLRLCASFFGVSFAYAGIMFALWMALRPNGMVINNGVVYFDVSPMLLLVSSIVAYLLILLLRRLTARSELHQRTVQLDVVLEGRETSMRALVDTGHSLNDVLSNAPVVVAEYAQIDSILPDNCRRLYREGNVTDVPEGFEKRFRMIPFSTIGGAGMLPAFRADRVILHEEKQSKAISTCVVAVLDSPLGEEYHALVGPEILEQDGRN